MSVMSVSIFFLVWICKLTCGVPLQSEATRGGGMPLTLGTDGLTLLVAVVSLAVVVSLVAVVFSCMDCCNSEVDSTSHPAAAAGASKWGGGQYESYGVTSTLDVNQGVMDATIAGGVVSPHSQQQPLPYSMFPASVPEQAGFAGYGAPQSGGSAPTAGYGAPSTQGFPASPHRPGPPGGVGTEEEPPPSYSETVHSQYGR